MLYVDILQRPTDRAMILEHCLPGGRVSADKAISLAHYIPGGRGVYRAA